MKKVITNIWYVKIFNTLIKVNFFSKGKLIKNFV